MAKRFSFNIALSGVGDTPEEAWADACEALSLDNGEPPENEAHTPQDSITIGFYTVDEDEDEDIGEDD